MIEKIKQQKTNFFKIILFSIFSIIWLGTRLAVIYK